MLSSTRAGGPDRLTVQLPPAGLEATDRDYSTQVFTPDEIGFVHLEFQVSHHVRENEFVVAALFSWGSGITMKSRRA